MERWYGSCSSSFYKHGSGELPQRWQAVSRLLGLSGFASGAADVLGGHIMLRLAIAFLVIALILAFFGFLGPAAIAWEGFKVLALIFVVLAVISFLVGGFRSPPV
jgi:uncharacterized membrane protein YtjA (UPF0391 family)